MNEMFFLKRLNESPGNISLLREYAAWLNERGDPRGQHLAAELDFYDAEHRFVEAEYRLGSIRGSRPQDFDWLNSVHPMVTRAPVDGAFYSASRPDDEPCVQLGDFCLRTTLVCIIESRKSFFPISAGHSGIISEVCVGNGASVVAGDPLFKLVRPQKADALQARKR